MRRATAAPSDEAPRLFATAADRRTATLAWAAALATSFALIAAVGFRTGDPDSSLYAGISARMATEPFGRWIAPEWWGHWGLDGPYHEHPIGLFLLPALVARLGYPGPQAAYAVNGLFQILSIVLVQLIAAHLVRAREARALGWIVQLMPIAFVFRVRANQEYAVLAGVLFALYACERARTRPAWIAGMLAGFLAVLLVKGVFAFMVPVTCVLWLLARGRVSQPEAQSRAEAAAQGRRPGARSAAMGVPVAAWLGILLMPFAGIAAAWVYETAYLHVTGRSFLEVYRARQVPEGALTSGSPIVRTAYNLVWYTARVAWFAFPWGLVAAAGVLTELRATHMWPASSDSPRVAHGEPRRNGAAGAHGDDSRSSPGRRADRQGAWFAAAATIALVVAFSLAHRKADRYIFPTYYLMAAAGGVTALRFSPRVSRVADRLDRPWTPAAFWLALFLLRLATGSHLPQFTFWRS